MSKLLLICDCDEVLLHMVAHFQDWLRDERAIRFDFETGQFEKALTFADTEELVPREQVWPLLGDFFMAEMHRQTLVPGAAEALETLGEHGDIVILTNINQAAHALRVDQLRGFGLEHEVVCNSGGKGVMAAELVERHGASHAVFVDDLPNQHASVARHAPQVRRLHMVAEPRLAPAIPPADAAHARIDDWGTATDWILRQWEVA